VELVEEHLLPRALQVLPRVVDVRIGGALAQCRNGGPALRVEHGELRATLPRLDAGVRRVAPWSVVLQVIHSHLETIEELRPPREHLVEVLTR
jgi:hypothetical protein